MMRVLVIRPRPDADALAARLGQAGIEAVVAPLLEVVFHPEAVGDLDAVGTLLLTSANGARALAPAGEHRGLRVLAVGKATAAAAREAGFADVLSADGDADALVRLARSEVGVDSGLVLHAAGAHVAGDIESALSAAGFACRRAVVYEARAVDVLPDEAAAALAEGGLDGVLLYSPRSARLLGELMTAAGLGGAASRLTAWCLSEAVAEAAGALAWRRLAVAKAPTGEAMLTMLRRAAGGGQPRRRILALSGAAVVAVAVVALAVRFAAPPPEIVAPAPVPVPTVAVAVAADTAAPRIASLEARVAALEAAPGRRGEAATPAALAALAADNAALGARLDVLDDALGARLDGLATALGDTRAAQAGLEARLAATDFGAGRAGALLLAVAQLRAAVASGRPFAADVATLAALAAGDAEVVALLPPLAAAAATGVRDAGALRAAFPALAVAVLGAIDAPADDAWLDRAMAEIGGLVTVRRVGEVEGEGAEAVLARAELRLADGDLAAAVALLESLDSSAPEAGEWLAAAAAALAAEAALAALTAAALARSGEAGRG